MSTFRVDLIAHLRTLALTYSTAHPTILRRVHTSRPGSFGELPLLFFGDRTGSTREDSGTVIRELYIPATIVDTFGDNEQTQGRMDIAADALFTAYTTAANVHVAGSGGIVVLVTEPADGEVQQLSADGTRTVYYRSTTMTITGLIQEGRP